MVILVSHIRRAPAPYLRIFRPLAGAEDKSRRGEAEGGRDRPQVALRRRDDREEVEQQAERTPGRAAAARESNYTDAGPAPIAATKSLQRSR